MTDEAKVILFPAHAMRAPDSGNFARGLMFGLLAAVPCWAIVIVPLVWWLT